MLEEDKETRQLALITRSLVTQDMLFRIWNRLVKLKWMAKSMKRGVPTTLLVKGRRLRFKLSAKGHLLLEKEEKHNEWMDSIRFINYRLISTD